MVLSVGTINSSLGGVRALFSSCSLWCLLYLTATLKGLVRLAVFQFSIAVGGQVSPPKPGMFSTSPRSSSLSHEAIKPSTMMKQYILNLFIFLICYLWFVVCGSLLRHSLFYIRC